jgi:hypothetical protein
MDRDIPLIILKEKLSQNYVLWNKPSNIDKNRLQARFSSVDDYE